MTTPTTAPVTAPLLHIPTIRLATHLRRLGAAALVVASVLAAPEPARAGGGQTAGEDACAPDADSLPLAGAHFAPRRVDGGLAWDARFVVTSDAPSSFRGGALRFAAPLPAGEELVATQGLDAIVEAGRVAGLCVGEGALQGRTVSASFFQPLSGEGAIALGAPIATGRTVQIVDTSVGDARLELTDAPLLEKHVGFVAPRGIGPGAREEARRLTGVREHVSASPIYLRGEDARGGLTVRLADPRARDHTSAIAVGVAFAAVVGGLVLAARRLRRAASVERADALLASEIEAAAKGSRG
ncbi:MAG: hypothetical protein KF795_30940 [Labilithrix sp.]|nr:hypothetical protein [Labilithrix sp.]